MLLNNGESTKDLHWGKFDNGMAVYLYHALMDGSEGNEWNTDGDGEWYNRYGRRVLSGDNRGFIYCQKFDTEEEAKEVCREADEQWRGDECECEFGDCYHD